MVNVNICEYIKTGCMPALQLPHDGGQLKLSGTQDWACPLILYLPAVPPTHIYKWLFEQNQ